MSIGNGFSDNKYRGHGNNRQKLVLIKIFLVIHIVAVYTLTTHCWLSYEYFTYNSTTDWLFNWQFIRRPLFSVLKYGAKFNEKVTHTHTHQSTNLHQTDQAPLFQNL